MGRSTKNATASSAQSHSSGIHPGLVRKAASIVQKHKESFLPLGPYASVAFIYPSASIIYVDERAPELTGMAARQLLTSSLYALFNRLVVPEHLQTALRMGEESFRHLFQNPSKKLVANLEFNGHRKKGEVRRFLHQATPNHDGRSAGSGLLIGHLTDISHVVNGGPPRMTIVKDGRIDKMNYASPEEILAATPYRLNSSDLLMLRLKRRGLRTKEIANAMHMRELSVFSRIRDIKQRTGLDILPLLQQLEQMGAIPVQTQDMTSV